MHFQTKNLQKPDLAMPSEDSTCAICDDSEGENSNAIVFCDGCNLAVHQGKLFMVYCHFFFLFLNPKNASRLLWCTVHPRRSMALPEVYGLPRESCCKLIRFLLPVIFLKIHSRNAYCVRMKVEHSSKPYTENGFIFFAPFGSLRHELQMRFSWNLSRE